jgi:6-phosphogluconolactonase
VVRGWDPGELVRGLLELVIRTARRSVGEKGSFTMGLAGGSSPAVLYRAMAETFPYWEESYFLPTDERYVPPEDPRSNYRMIRENLGERARVYRIRTELPLEEACREFHKELERVGGLDLVLLGIGADGHTASLFPHAPCRPCGSNACVSRSPDGLERVSMSLEFLNRSGTVAFLVYGERKRGAVEKLLRGEDVPAARVKGRGEVYLFTDIT